MKKYIVIDLKSQAALHGIDKLTLIFDTDIEAINLARQFFRNDEDYIITLINIKK